MLVKAPVATTQAVPGLVFKSAVAMALTAGSCICGTAGEGRRRVPSSPEVPWISPAWTAGRISPFAAPA
jgi:hypothetical protein